MENGTTQQFYATGTYADNSFQDVTSSVTWSSSDQTKATISNTSGSAGLATGVAAGTSTISATLDGISASTALTVNAITLSSITVIPPRPSIPNGLTRQFYAVGIYSDNSYQNLTSLVTWSSSNQSIATISNISGESGKATSKSVGSTTITASMNSVTGAALLTVAAPTLDSISVTPTNQTAAKGTTQQFTATGLYSDDSTNDLTSDVTWNTGSALTAIISNRSASKGLALARNEGTTSVSATLGSISGSTDFTVTTATLSSIYVSPTNQAISAGETQQYRATGIYTDFRIQDLTDKATWTSSNTAIATISNAPSSHGLAKGLSIGTATISATQGDVTGSTVMTVHAATLVSIAVTPTLPTIANGTQQQFTATGTYSDASTRDLTSVATWVSTAPSIAVISNVSDSKGLATTIAAGSTTIQAIFSGITGSTTLTVSAATLTSIAVTPANASVAQGTTAQFTATGTYSDLSTKIITNEVTWNSSTPSKATVSNADPTKGLVFGVSEGPATIRAIEGGLIGSTSVNIVDVKIGHSFNGGIVACLEGGLNNLITANANNSNGITWGASGTTTNAQSTVDGQANTTTIVNLLGAGTTYAAGVCDAYEIDSAGNTPCVGGNTCYNDWFLPSTNQIQCLQDNRNQIGGFDKDNYWSSTEDSASSTTKAFYITFANSGHPPASANKTNTYKVRCVRLMSAFP
ncbi:MAG: Ig-like domain-containing protein [Gammaproteobacteria bacterium]|nr:Ig-like domain-containing protein [Gammaproteobacteria bacterium]